MGDPRTTYVALVETQLPRDRRPHIYQFARKLGKRLVLLWRKSIGQTKMQPVLQA